MNIPIIPRWIPLVACVLLGLMLGWWLWHPRAAPIETAAPTIILKDGAQVAARVPDAPIPEAVPQAVKQLHGAKLVRAIGIDVTPKSKDGTTVCTPEHIDVGIVKMPDSTERVIVSDQSGDITKAIDIPVTPLPPIQRQLKWAAGASYDVINRRYGAFIDRDLGPFRLGVEILQPAINERSFTAVAKIGIRF